MKLFKHIRLPLLISLVAGMVILGSPSVAGAKIIERDGCKIEQQNANDFHIVRRPGESGRDAIARCQKTFDAVLAEQGKKLENGAIKDMTGERKDPVSGEKVKNTSVIEYIDAAYKWAAIFGGLLAVMMLVYAGYRYMSSYGDPEKIADARQIIEQTLIGLGLLILAALILQTINPDTLQCKQNCGSIDFGKPKG